VPPLSLLVTTDERLVRVLVPARRRIVLGRAEGCDVRIDDGSVSRRHAVLHLATRVAIEDLGSANGTWVLGARLPHGGRAALPLGAAFELAGTTLILQVRRKLPPDAVGPARAKKKLAAVVVADPAMVRRYALLDVIAASDLDVLVAGEAGTGKRVFAETLIARSPRAKKPLVVVDGGTIDPRSMADALKGAVDGTLLVQRADELPPAIAPKLLAAPKGHKARRIFTAHGDGVALARAIGGFSMYLPPLRERREDILPLARAFASRSAAQLDEPVPEISEQAANALTRHDWPRNVRELQGVIDRAIIDADGAAWIDLEHLRLPRYD
jgi:transcriptional regulator with AAA-type ATPase domain